MVQVHLPLPMARWSRGQDTALSRRNHEFDSRSGHHEKVLPRLFGGSFLFLGRIAQLVRAFASHARGRGFESPCVHQICGQQFAAAVFFILNLDFCGQRVSISLVPHAWLRLDAICAGLFLRNFYCRIQPMVKNYFLASVG